MVSYTCEGCGRVYNLPDSKMGKRVRCRACGATGLVEGEGEAPCVSVPPPVPPDVAKALAEKSRHSRIGVARRDSGTDPGLEASADLSRKWLLRLWNLCAVIGLIVLVRGLYHGSTSYAVKVECQDMQSPMGIYLVEYPYWGLGFSMREYPMRLSREDGGFREWTYRKGGKWYSVSNANIQRDIDVNAPESDSTDDSGW